MKSGFSRTPTRNFTGISKNRVKKLQEQFEPKRTQKKRTSNSSRKKSNSKSSRPRLFQSLEEPINLKNKNCPNNFLMILRKVNKPQVDGHKYTLVIKKESERTGCKYPLLLKSEGIRVSRTYDSSCINDEDIKNLIAHINIELDNRDDKDMFSSIQELINFLTIQIKTFCPAGIYRNPRSLRYKQNDKPITPKVTAKPPKVPTKRRLVESNPNPISIQADLSNEGIVKSILKNKPSPVSAVLDASARSPVKIPTRFPPKIKNIATQLSALSTEPIYQNLLIDGNMLMSEKGSKYNEIKDKLNKFLLYENVEKTNLPSKKTEQNEELYDVIQRVKVNILFRVKGFFTVVEKFYEEKRDMGQFLLDLNEIAEKEKTKESRKKRDYGHKLILKFAKNEELFKKVKGKFDEIIKDLEIGFINSKTYEDLIINLLLVVSIYTNEFITFIVNNYYFDFIELIKMGFFNKERASKYSKIIRKDLIAGDISIIYQITGKVQQGGLNTAAVTVNDLFKEFSKQKYEIKNKENILEEIKFVINIFDERINFFQDAVACIKKTIVNVKDGISSYKEQKDVKKGEMFNIDGNPEIIFKKEMVTIDTIDELKSCVDQQMVTSDTKDELCNELKKSKGFLKKLSKKNRFRQKAYNTLCKNVKSKKTKKRE